MEHTSGVEAGDLCAVVHRGQERLHVWFQWSSWRKVFLCCVVFTAGCLMRVGQRKLKYRLQWWVQAKNQPLLARSCWYRVEWRSGWKCMEGTLRYLRRALLMSGWIMEFLRKFWGRIRTCRTFWWVWLEVKAKRIDTTEWDEVGEFRVTFQNGTRQLSGLVSCLRW